MHRATEDSGPMWCEECSGSGSSFSFKASGRHQVHTKHMLSSLAAQEDDEVHFDTKFDAIKMDLGEKNIVELIAKVIEEASDSDNLDVLVAGRHYPSIQEFASAIPNHLLLGSLLEHLCFVYESNPARSRMLFKVIGQQLAAMNFLSPLAISDEFSTVRLQHNRAFTELLNAASSSLYSQGQQHLRNSLNSSIKPKEGLVQAQASRYLSEFEEVSRLGRGSYGNVCKVLNKFDGQHYAMKKILIKQVSKEDCMKVLREVKVLSSLQHVHVVGYHTAWMEHVQPAAYPDSLFPALESPEPDSSGESFDSTFSSSIVFQSLSHPQTDAASSVDVPPKEKPPITALVSAQQGPVVCPKMMRRIPENYVPCVFLGQKNPKQTDKCPVADWDASLLEESSRSSLELNNNSYVDKECHKQVDKCIKKPTREVQFHLMLYIQMQLCERSLKDWMAERNAKPRELTFNDPYDCVDAEHTLILLRHILEGVEYIHSKGIMHRDLKPRNIFLHGQDCQVRIGDFGLACKDIIIESFKGSASANSDYMHTSGVGTFVYAAPEQLNGSNYNSMSDMYSIGVLALELFQPFGTEMERIQCLGDLREGKILDSFRDRWPVLTKYIVQLLSKEPSVRPTASQLLESELFCSKDTVIRDLRRKVGEQEEEIMELRRQISELQSSQVPDHLTKQDLS